MKSTKIQQNGNESMEGQITRSVRTLYEIFLCEILSLDLFTEPGISKIRTSSLATYHTEPQCSLLTLDL